MTVTFCGHRSVFGSEQALSEQLDEELAKIFKAASRASERLCFYCGGYGAFDRLAENAIDRLRNRFADVECEKILVTPYIGRFRSENTEQMRARYDDTAVYPSLETVPYRLAIVRRNEWMVLCSDIVIAFVQHRWGGAAATLKYAQRKGKNIIYLHG